jgi:hypothetical protein
MKFILLVTLTCLTVHLHARPKIVTFSGEELAYPAPLKCFFSNTRMVAHGENLLINYTCFSEPELHSEVWQLDSTGSHQKVFSSGFGNLLGDPASDGRNIYAMENSEVSTERFWRLENGKALAESLPAEWKQSLIQSIAPLGPEKLLLRFTRDRASQEGQWEKSMWEELPQRGVNFFFTPGWSPEQIVQKVRLGDPNDLSESRPDEIQVRLAPLFAPVTVLRDRDGDVNSPYLSFLNFSVANDKYWVVSANRAEGMVAIVGVGTTFQEIPLYAHFKTVDPWPLALDSTGRIILRATSHRGQLGLWLLSKTDAKPSLLLKSGDIVEAPGLGKAQVISPFYNAPLIIESRVYIGVGLGAPTNGRSIGQGVLEIVIP